MEREQHVSLAQTLLDNHWKPFCMSSTATHTLGDSPDLTDDVMFDYMLLLLNTWYTLTPLTHSREKQRS
jgi:hypothetical protein